MSAVPNVGGFEDSGLRGLTFLNSGPQLFPGTKFTKTTKQQLTGTIERQHPINSTSNQFNQEHTI